MDDFSKQVWEELRHIDGALSKKEKEDRHAMVVEFQRERIKKIYPDCCAWWWGCYVQKDYKKLVRRITKENMGFSQPLQFCPECGKAFVREI